MSNLLSLFYQLMYVLMWQQYMQVLKLEIETGGVWCGMDGGHSRSRLQWKSLDFLQLKLDMLMVDMTLCLLNECLCNRHNLGLGTVYSNPKRSLAPQIGWI